MAQQYDFSGWATRANLKCSDGRTIMKGAFDDNNGKKVPLVWNHVHNDPMNVLGHAILESRDNGMYAYCYLNNTDSGNAIKEAVKHGDIASLSIYANELKQQGTYVIHGNIRELSVVLAGANPGAYIDTVLVHGEESSDEAIIYNGEEITMMLKHSDTDSEQEKTKSESSSEGKEETVRDVYNTLSDKQKEVVHFMIGEALEEASGKKTDEESDEGEDSMKHNLFEKDDASTTTLSHSDEQNIIDLAKSSSVGSLQDAIGIYMEQNDTLAHGIDDIEQLFPEYKDLYPGAPELLTRDQGWVSVVMSKTHKSPISRIRTRQMDVRGTDLRAYGYQKGAEKKVPGNMKLLKRTTDPQTVYRKDALNRDDIIDITDFDVVEYQYGVMRQNLNEELATAIMIGDGRDEGDEMKIYEEHIRSIWNDDDLYAIHYDVDIDAARNELQGSKTSMSFGENYIYAEAIITAALYSREKFKGTGTPDLFCTPHLLNVMLLARDMNGRRIYDSKSDLAQALNVGDIHTAEQFEGLVRTTDTNAKKKLLGIFVNLADYTIGSTKGGEITRFNQFDIDFNQEKYLIETRLSGALTRVYSAVVLEEPVSSDTTDSTTSG